MRRNLCSLSWPSGEDCCEFRCLADTSASWSSTSSTTPRSTSLLLVVATRDGAVFPQNFDRLFDRECFNGVPSSGNGTCAKHRVVDGLFSRFDHRKKQRRH